MILQQGLPPRVERLVAGLQQAYGTGPLAPEQFYLEREGCE
jgi:elongation factor P hydroxylase